MGWVCDHAIDAFRSGRITDGLTPSKIKSAIKFGKMIPIIDTDGHQAVKEVRLGRMML